MKSTMMASPLLFLLNTLRAFAMPELVQESSLRCN
jgi:hypothetical protein